MMNLLPELDKRQIRNEYRARLTVVVLFGVFTTFVVATALLAPSYIIAQINKDNIKEQQKLLSEQEKDDAHLRTVISQTNTRITTLAEHKDRASVYADIVDPIVSTRGDVAIATLSYRHGEDADVVRVSGVAPHRDALLSFIDALESVAAFKTVNTPVSNFVDRTDIEFSLEITLN